MNISHLKYVMEVEQTKSITKAAQNLFMGQPNLSKAIKELEKEIGITLFKRTQKGVEATPKGQEFIAYARSILQQIEDLESMYKPQGDQPLSFSVSVPRATYVSYAFSCFVNQLPQDKKITFYFKETASIEAANDVSCGESDLGILRYPEIYEEYFLSLLDDKNLRYEVLWKFTMTLLMSQNHPLASLPQIEYSMLTRYTEVLHEDLQVPFLSFSQMQHQNKLEHPEKKIYIYERGSQFDLLEQVPETFMWVSSIPENVLKKHGLVLKLCNAPGILNKDVLIYRRNHRLQDHERLFIETLQQETSRLAQESVDRRVREVESRLGY